MKGWSAFWAGVMVLIMFIATSGPLAVILWKEALNNHMCSGASDQASAQGEGDGNG